MTGTNSPNDRLTLRQNVEINSNWYFSYDIFSGMKSSTTWNGNAIVQSPRKMSEFRDISNTSDVRFLMVYRTIIDVIFHSFIICNELWRQLPLIHLIGVCADHDQPEFHCSRSDSRYHEVHVATAGGWLTRYHPREVRNSIYRYRKIDID